MARRPMTRGEGGPPSFHDWGIAARWLREYRGKKYLHLS
jgi:hypothetical protein